MKIQLMLAVCLLGAALQVYSQNIVEVEYFFDADAGVGKNTLLNVTPASDGSIPLQLKTDNITSGYHKLYVRAKDSNGKWGTIARRSIEILPTLTTATIVAGEYFFDSDPGFGMATSVEISNPDTSINQVFPVITGNLSLGYHKLYTRFKNSDGKWGLSARRNIELVKEVENGIVKAEWFVDKDPGFGNATPIPLNITDTTAHSYLLPFPCIEADSNYFLYTRVQDAKGNWSMTSSPQNKFSLIDATRITTIKPGNWNDPSVWSNDKIPDANTYIVLNHEITVNVVASCKYLLTLCHPVKINSGASLNITGRL